MNIIPIDDGALTGACHLLRDELGHLHCGRWSAQLEQFEYSNGQPIRSTITHYYSRNPPACFQEKPDAHSQL